MNPAVSIVICTCNRAESLSATLESLGRIEVPSDLPTELLVVDNGSTDRTRDVAVSANLPNMETRYIYEPRRGKAYAYNAALTEARGDVFLCTDDDVRVPTNWIEGMCRPLWNNQVDGVQGGARPAAHLAHSDFSGIYRNVAALVEPNPERVPATLAGINMAFHRRVLRRMRGFSVELGPGAAGLGEDTLWGYQLISEGYRLAFVSVTVEHHFDPSRLNAAYYYDWARRAGNSDAIISFRWRNDAPKYPRLVYAWHLSKYVVRSMISWRQGAVPAHWRMWYRRRMAYAAKCVELSRSQRLQPQQLELRTWHGRSD